MRMSIVIPKSSTILGMIKTRRMGSDAVTIKLPQNWYENNDFLGFALCCVYTRMLRDDESEDDGLSCKLNLNCIAKFSVKSGCNSSDDSHLSDESKDDGLSCKLMGRGNNQIQSIAKFSVKSGCNSLDVSHLSDQMCVIYYPKDAIKEEFRFNQWTHFTASFDCVRYDFHVEECGIHLIYANCFQRQQHEECQRELCLKGCVINELPVIEFPYELSSLCLRECQNLDSLPSTICELNSLTTLSCSGCSRLKSFPEIPPKGLENLRKLHLDGTAIQELPSSIRNLKGLQYVNLAYCDNLLSLPETICRLK